VGDRAPLNGKASLLLLAHFNVKNIAYLCYKTSNLNEEVNRT
jgi:hypothetical protein